MRSDTPPFATARSSGSPIERPTPSSRSCRRSATSRSRCGSRGTTCCASRTPTLADFKARPNATGIPFMGPWANRLDEQAFYANGKRYAFDMSLGNVRGAIPIHGFLTTTDQWQVTSVRSTGSSGVGDEPARVLPSAGVDEAVAVRAHDRDDVPAGERRARSRHDDHQHERRPDAGRDRVPSLLSADRLAARRVDDRRRRAHAVDARREQGADRRNGAHRARSSNPAAHRCATTTSTTCSATSCATRRAAPR